MANNSLQNIIAAKVAAGDFYNPGGGANASSSNNNSNNSSAANNILKSLIDKKVAAGDFYDPNNPLKSNPVSHLTSGIPSIPVPLTAPQSTPSAPTMPSIVFGTAPLPTPKTQDNQPDIEQLQKNYDDARREIDSLQQGGGSFLLMGTKTYKDAAARLKDATDALEKATGNKAVTSQDRAAVEAAKGIGRQTAASIASAGTTLANAYAQGQSQSMTAEELSLAKQSGGIDKYLQQKQTNLTNENDWVNKAQSRADELFARGAENIEAAKSRVGKEGAWVIDASTAMAGIAMDAIANTVVPGSGLVNMAIRVFGQSAAETRANGGDLNHQVINGVKSAAIELATEKIMNLGVFKSAYGRQGMEDLVENGIDKFFKSEVGKALAKTLAGGIGEGTEEVASDVLNDIFDYLLAKIEGQEANANLITPEFWQQAIYDGLTGFALGLVGATGNLANINTVKQGARSTIDNTVAEAAQNAPQATQAEIQQQTQPTQANASTAQNEALNNPTNVRTAQIMQTLTQSGMDAAVAQEQAGYIVRLANGEKLSGSDIRNVLTQNPAVQQAFTEATGIEVPKGATASELRKVFNSVGEQATTASAEATKPQTEIDNILAQPAQAEQTNTAQNDTTPIYQNDSSQGVQTEETMPAVVGENVASSQSEIDNILNQQQGTQLNSFTEEERQPGMKRSKTESNTEQSVASKLGGEQEELYYMPITEKQTLMEAVNRVTTDMVGEVEKLTSKEMWTAADIDTAMTIYGKLMSDGIKNGDPAAANTWSKVVQSHGTSSGQALQAFSKWSRTGAAQAVNCSQQIEESSLSPEDKEKISADIFKFGEDFDNVADGDTDSIKDIIRRLNQYRGTGTFADAIRSKGGESVDTNFAKMLDKETDFDYLKEFAWRQMQAVTDDAITRPSLAQKLKAWQVLSQLSRLTTFGRNLGGNMAFGFQDMLANNSFALAIDSIVSKFTGKKTVGMEKGWLSSAVRENAAKELNRSILEVAADINMRSSGNRYDQSTSRTFKMNGGIGQRFMSRWQQGLSYSLSSSDAYFRGGIEQSVKDSLKNSGLTESEINEIAKTTADYRLFQNDGKTAQRAKELRNWLNGIASVTVDENGNSFGLGDALLPYPGVPANVGIKALEYSPANIVKGGKELIQVFKDAKAGKLDVTKQNQAVTDISRGMSGLPLIALLTAAFKGGFVKNWDDEEDLDAKAQNSAEGKSGVQINLDALMRSFNHESAEWQDGDDLMSISWLEPLNAFMAIASLIASDEGEGLGVYAGDYIEGTIQSVLDLPMMGTIKDIFDTWQYSTADTSLGKLGDVVINFAGNAATGMIPAPFGQTAKTIDPYFRDTNADSEIGRIMNTAMSNIPGLRETLPVKNDSYGNPKQYASSAGQRFLNNFILPGAVNELHQTAESSEVERIYKETGDAAVYPDRKAPNSIKVDGENIRLNTEEKRTYQETYGQAYQASIAKLMDGKKWENIPAEQQAAILSEAKSMATYEAKSEFFESKGSKYSNNQLDYIMGLRNPEQYVQTKTLYNTAIDNKDYRAIDSIIRDMASTPETKNMLAKHDSDIKKLLEYRDQGFTNSKSYFAVKDAEAEYKEQNNLENLSNLDKANIIADTLKSNKEIDFLINETFGKERNLAYDTARSTGMSPKEAIALFDTIDGSNTGKTNNQLEKGELQKSYKNADPEIKNIIREIWIAKGYSPSQLR